MGAATGRVGGGRARITIHAARSNPCLRPGSKTAGTFPCTFSLVFGPKDQPWKRITANRSQNRQGSSPAARTSRPARAVAVAFASRGSMLCWSRQQVSRATSSGRTRLRGKRRQSSQASRRLHRPPPPPPEPRSPREGLWIAPDELKSLPISGSGWEAMLAIAEGDLDRADVADQDSMHDTNTLACALAAARTGSAELRGKAMDAMTSAIGTEENARWLAIGRNLGAYVIAADVLGVRSGPIYDWLAGFLTRTLRDNNTDEQVPAGNWSSGWNASAQMGFVTAALCVYTNDSARLVSSWDGYRRYCGDRTSPVSEASNSDAWQVTPSDPVGIQDKGATKEGCRLDGAIGNDMSRGGGDICSPHGRSIHG